MLFCLPTGLVRALMSRGEVRITVDYFYTLIEEEEMSGHKCVTIHGASTGRVTGGGSGIGRATSELLARRGCDLALVDVNEAGMAETAERVRATGRKASLHQADVSERAQMEALPEQVLREHRHVHIVMNNAGVGLTGTLEETSVEDFEWILGINFWGVFYGCKCFLPHLRREDEAHIVNVSSMLAFMGLPAQSAYCATKSAVRGLTEALYAELSDTRIGVTGVFPGATRTNIVRASRFPDEEQKQRIAERVERAAIPPFAAGSLVLWADDLGNAFEAAEKQRHIGGQIDQYIAVLLWFSVVTDNDRRHWPGFLAGLFRS